MVDSSPDAHTSRRRVNFSRRCIESVGTTMAERIIIIGSGPAAWTWAIYARRANLKPIVYEGAITEDNRLSGTLPLGQLNLTTEVENFPGFPHWINGPGLMMGMCEPAVNLQGGGI